MALKDWERQYDRTVNKWVWKNVKDMDTSEQEESCRPKRYRNLKNGFYPQEFNFLYYIREPELSCSYCGLTLPTRKLTRDHIYPKSRGGVLVTPCCMQCNQAKGDKKPIEWAIFYSENELKLARKRQMQA